jgi:hypothetical protein
MMASPRDREAAVERDRQQRETGRLAAEAKRRVEKGKPVPTPAEIETCWNALSPEGKAHVAMMAVHRAGVRPALSWLSR